MVMISIQPPFDRSVGVQGRPASTDSTELSTVDLDVFLVREIEGFEMCGLAPCGANRLTGRALAKPPVGVLRLALTTRPARLSGGHERKPFVAVGRKPLRSESR